MALEPEQIEKEINIDKVQKIWDKYKLIILITIVIIITVFIGSQVYMSSVKKSNEVASQIYQQIIMENIDNIDIIKEGVAQLKENHSATPYSSRGAIFLSRSLINKNMNDEAVVELLWASKNANEKSIESLSLYSLSNIYLASKNLEDAMTTANKISTPGYIGLKNDLLGDIYIAGNDKEKARISYEAALNFYLNKSELAKVIQTKIDAIGQ
jgi:predicted negative regulator of RcsB-dependent stress response|tara:strand:+ start:2306 stop:2941 length:636 start_codon:yes stop_codon:yes gene_type:complete